MGGESYVTHGMCPRDKPFDNDDEAMKVSDWGGWMNGLANGILVCDEWVYVYQCVVNMYISVW